MASTDVRNTILEIVNAVNRKLHVNTVVATTDTKLSTIFVQQLNEVITDISDSGDWLEFYNETVVTAVSGQSEYGLGLTSPIKSIIEIAVSSQTAPLYYQEIREINRLIRVGTTGVPRHYSLAGMDSQENPQFRISPIPGSSEDGQGMRVYYYEKPRLYTTSDDAQTPDLPANLLIQGLYMKALLYENGGEPSNEFLEEQKQYENLKQQALNRFTVDSGTDIFFTPDPSPGVR